MKKEKLRGIILGATISAAILVPKNDVYAAEVKSKGTVQNVSSNLRIRESASTNSAVVGSLKNNETVEIKGKTGDWYNIQHGNVSGYVYDEYIKISTDTSSGSAASDSSTGYVTNVSTSLRLRSNPSTSSNVLDYLKEGQALKIEGTDGSWYKVYVNGKTGYVSKEYVKTSFSASSSSVSNTKARATESFTAKSATLHDVSSELRLRSGASTSSSVIGYIYPGESFQVIGESGSWYQVNCNGKKGYASKEYIKVAGSSTGSSVNVTPLSTKTTSTYTAKNATLQNVSSSLRFRSSASTTGSVIGYLYPGSTFKVTGESGSWYQIEYDGKKGYASKEYVKITTGSTSSSSSSSSSSSQNSTSSGSTQTYAAKSATLQNVSSSLRFRSSASTTGSVIGYLYPGSTFKVTGESGSWYQIEYNGKKGYASKEYVKITTGSTSSSSNSSSSSSQNSTSSGSTQTYAAKDAVLQNVSSSLRLRSSASSSASVVGYLYPNSAFKVIGESGSWYYVDYNGKKGYASKSYIKIGTQSSSSGSTGSNTSSSTQSSSTYEKVLSIMKQQLGAPYVWGGAGEMLTTSLLDRLKAQFPSEASAGKYASAEKEVGRGYRAFDCSGLLYWCFGQAGVNIGRTTYSQVNNGVNVPLNQLKPGDLLFYKGLGHVGMYIGNGQWIESPRPGECVRIMSIPWSSIGSARRVL